MTLLVVSMTGGAVLLAVAEPASTSAARPRAGQSIDAVATLEDVSPVAIDYQRWQRVQIDPMTVRPAGDAITLIGQISEPDYHFCIRPDGRLLVGSAWARQGDAGAGPNVVCVALERAHNTAGPTTLQERSLNRLLDLLERQLGVAADAG